jgi:hypothetical protein
MDEDSLRLCLYPPHVFKNWFLDLLPRNWLLERKKTRRRYLDLPSFLEISFS